ncbi:unnamed protein product [Durusdinium trenchii]|uniref:Uncharacterized protein n=2 Tax=Durusdinium trenchii TaxID=1381693 RepID=A0ABP0L5A7_9DINO
MQAPWHLDYGNPVGTASSTLLQCYEDALRREKTGMPQRAPIAKPMSPWHTVPQWRRPSFLADEDFWASSSRIGVERVEPPSAQLATVSDLERLQEKQDQLLSELLEVKSLLAHRDAEMEALRHEVGAWFRRSNGTDWRTLSTVSAGYRSELQTPTLQGRPSPLLVEQSPQATAQAMSSPPTAQSAPCAQRACAGVPSSSKKGGTGKSPALPTDVKENKDEKKKDRQHPGCCC